MITDHNTSQDNLVLAQRIIRKRTVQAMTGLSDSSIWRLEHEGRFPVRVSLGSRAVGWYYGDIINWLEHREKKSITKPNDHLH